MELTMLSWALYFIDVVGNLRTLTGVSIFILLISIGLSLLFYLINISQNKKMQIPVLNSLGKLAIYGLIPLIVALSIVKVSLPTKETMRMIVGVEAANAVAQTDEAKEMLNLVKSRIKKSLED